MADLIPLRYEDDIILWPEVEDSVHDFVEFLGRNSDRIHEIQELRFQIYLDGVIREDFHGEDDPLNMMPGAFLSLTIEFDETATFGWPHNYLLEILRDEGDFPMTVDRYLAEMVEQRLMAALDLLFTFYPVGTWTDPVLYVGLVMLIRRFQSLPQITYI